MINLTDVTFSYDRKHEVIHNLSLDINPTSRYALMGPSGIGKTTLLRLIMNLESPTSGTITRSNKISTSAVFQEDRLLYNLSVLDNVSLFSSNKLAYDTLQYLGISPETFAEKPNHLSGGMKRRVALARALSHSFDILILDEPFSGLDDHSKELCINTIKKFCQNKALILSTHDISDAHKLGCVILDINQFSAK